MNDVFNSDFPDLGCWWPLVTVVSGGGPGDPLDLKQDLDMTRKATHNIIRTPIQLNGGDFNRKREIGWLAIYESANHLWLDDPWWLDVHLCACVLTDPPPELPLAADFIDSFSALSTARPCKKMLNVFYILVSGYQKVNLRGFLWMFHLCHVDPPLSGGQSRGSCLLLCWTSRQAGGFTWIFL